MIPRLDISSFSMDNGAREQSVPVDLRKRVSIGLIQTESKMEYTFRPAKQYASNKALLVHGDYLNESSQMSNILEDLFEDISKDLGMEPSIADYVSEEEHFGRINTHNVDESRGLNVEIRDKVLPTKKNNNDTTKAWDWRMAKFTLPPDYEPNNSKWTLRYRNPKPELTELLRYSGIYVNTLSLKCCNEIATDCKSLARMLMIEVFSYGALKVCSLTGARTTFYGNSKTEVRPGLDKDARDVLIKYVETYGEKRGWCTKDRKNMMNSMRNKLYSWRHRKSHRV